MPFVWGLHKGKRPARTKLGNTAPAVTENPKLVGRSWLENQQSTDGAVNSLCEPDTKDQVRIAGEIIIIVIIIMEKMALEIEQKNKPASYHFHSQWNPISN